VDATRTQPFATPELAREAESLICRLAGVRHARVLSGPRGIDAIHVVASDHHVAPDLAARVRSALLAGIAAPVLPARIHVRVTDDATPHADAAAIVDAPPEPSQPSHRVRLLENGHRGEPQARHDPPHAEDPPHAGEWPRRAPSQAAAGPTARPRLVAVDLERRQDGRVLCRVAIAFAAHVHSAAALAVDLPGAAAQAAAQAAVRALIDAGIAGLELNGLREVEIAGRYFVIVALRRTDTSRRLRSGSAPVIGSAERAAAEATVVAANELI
jgi:hypothetical protein